MPDFIQFVPDENRRYGYAGAAVLALIRWRCGSDGPGRVVVDGVRWWRVSLAELAAEIGGSVSSVRTALKRLCDAVATEHFPPLANPSLAYRPLREIAAGAQAAAKSDTTSCEKSQQPVSDLAAVPLIETLETGGDAAGGPDESGGLAAVPDPANDPAPQNAATGEPHRFCDEHMPDGTDDPCHACGRRRVLRERWEAARAEAARRARPPRPPWRCLTCRDTGIVLSDDGEPAGRGDQRWVCIHEDDGGRSRRLMTDAERARFASALRRLTSKDGLDETRAAV